jgi:hypothetical protein
MALGGLIESELSRAVDLTRRALQRQEKRLPSELLTLDSLRSEAMRREIRVPARWNSMIDGWSSLVFWDVSAFILSQKQKKAMLRFFDGWFRFLRMLPVTFSGDVHCIILSVSSVDRSPEHHHNNEVQIETR